VSSKPTDPRPSLDDAEAVFNALAHEARRHVLLLLSQLGGELPSGYLAARFQHSWPTTSRHLKVLEDADLVQVRREGRGSHYRLNRERVERVVGGWLRQLEPVGPDKQWRSPGPKTTSELASPSRAPNVPQERKKTKNKPTPSKGHRP
jgi:DNA-binding transcriptional ArsR family regulator